MSHAAISPGVAGLPNPKRSAAAVAPCTASRVASASAAAAPRARSEDLQIGDGAGRVDAPGLDRVVVIDRARAAYRAQLPDRRLDEAGVVLDPRLQQRRTAVPLPVEREAGQGLGLDGRLQ